MIRLGVVLLGGALMAGGAYASPDDVMKKAGCTACHAQDKKLVGPSYKDIAAKYKGKDATAELMQKVRVGGKGAWGPVPMPPHPASKISDDDLKAVITAILS